MEGWYNRPAVSIADDGRYTMVTTPRSDLFAHHVGAYARFDRVAGAWVLPSKNRPQLELLLFQAFGWRPEHNGEVTIVRFDMVEDDEASDVLRLGPMIVAMRTTRDSDPLLAPFTQIVAGEFATSGGSVKYPRLLARVRPIRFEIRDFPVEWLIDVKRPVWLLEQEDIILERVEAERARLMDRVRRIDEWLAAPSSREPW